MTNGETLARACANAAADKKADDLVVLHMQGVSTVTDFFVICSASSEPQLKAIANSIREQVQKEAGRKPLSAEGSPVSQWIVLDYGEVIVHLFHSEKRGHYGLENLWSDATRLKFEG
jgi:ribosome-associated protein